MYISPLIFPGGLFRIFKFLRFCVLYMPGKWSKEYQWVFIPLPNPYHIVFSMLLLTKAFFMDAVLLLCLAVSRAIAAWKVVLFGRFRLLDQWCDFVEVHDPVLTFSDSMLVLHASTILYCYLDVQMILISKSQCLLSSVILCVKFSMFLWCLIEDYLHFSAYTILYLNWFVMVKNLAWKSSNICLRLG